MEPSTAWFGVAIVALTLLLVLCCFVGVLAGIYTRQQRAAKRTVWPDPESGADPPPSPGNGTCKKTTSHLSSRQDLQRAAPTDLVETLRGLLKEEIGKALHSEGISERLQRLEQREEATRGRSVNERLELLERERETAGPAWPPPPAPQVQVPPPPSTADIPRAAALRAAAAGLDEAPQAGELGEEAAAPSGRALGFGPTSRQLRLPDPPETSFDVNEDAALKMSLKTIQKQLHKRDTQTTELHRQLRQCQEALWEQTLEARSASKRLRDLLMDPSQVDAEHARELEHLQGEMLRMSSKLADAKDAEMRWSWIAKRQRAFFMQSEKMGQEGLDLVRRHPAGEVFLAPPPVCLEGDDEHCRSLPWDVGTSHINPYAIDSWPFEPNVLAQKASVEPNLDRLDEEGSGSGLGSASASEEEEEEEEEDSPSPRPPDDGPPGAYDVEPPGVPHPEAEAGLPSQTARSF